MSLILLLNIFFASTFIIGKAVLNYSSPIFFIAVRMLLAGFLLLFYQIVIKKKKLNLNKIEFIELLWLSIIYIYIPFIFEFWALQYISPAKTALLYSLTPFFTAIFSYHIIKERLSLKKIIGLILGIIGFFPTFIPWNLLKELNLSSFLLVELPEFALLISVISAAYAWIYIQSTIKKQIHSYITINGISMFLGGFLALLTSIIFETWNPLPIYDFKNFALLTVLMIIVGNILSYNLYGYLLHKYTATYLAFTGFTIPLFTAIMEWIAFKEVIHSDFIISSIIVFVGLYIFHQDELR